MSLRLEGMQETESEAQNLGQYRDRHKKINNVFYHPGLLFMSEAIEIEISSRQEDNLLAGYFCNKKTRELLARKYY